MSPLLPQLSAVSDEPPESGDCAALPPPVSTEPALERLPDAARTPLTDLSPNELMTRYVSGEIEAFDHLYRKVAPKLLGFLIALTRNRARAEDLLQLTFLKVHRARASYILGAPVLPWLIAIARRCYFDEIRAMRTRPEDTTADGSLPEVVVESPQHAEDALGALRTALQSIREDYREAIRLTKLLGFTSREAAVLLGTTPSAVKLRVHRGYRDLRAVLGALEPADSATEA